MYDPSIEEIAEHLMNIELSDYKDVKLKNGLKVSNPQLFVNSHIEILERNANNKRFKPYYERLLNFYLITK